MNDRRPSREFDLTAATPMSSETLADRLRPDVGRQDERDERESGSEAKLLETGHDADERSRKGGLAERLMAERSSFPADGNFAALDYFSARTTEAEETPHRVSRKVQRWCPRRQREQRARSRCLTQFNSTSACPLAKWCPFLAGCTAIQLSFASLARARARNGSPWI